MQDERACIRKWHTAQARDAAHHSLSHTYIFSLSSQAAAATGFSVVAGAILSCSSEPMCPWTDLSQDKTDITCARTRTLTNASSQRKGLTYISAFASVHVVSLENIAPFFACKKFASLTTPLQIQHFLPYEF